jgi:hypothetical protein
MNASDTPGIDLDDPDWFARLSGPDWKQQRADLREHLRLLETRLTTHAAVGQTSEAWARLQAARTAVGLAIEIVERLPAPSV